MMTFKRFLATQDDSITDEEAIAKYAEYKMDFKRQELRKFFMTHKDEQWWVMGTVDAKSVTAHFPHRKHHFPTILSFFFFFKYRFSVSTNVLLLLGKF